MPQSNIFWFNLVGIFDSSLELGTFYFRETGKTLYLSEMNKEQIEHALGMMFPKLFKDPNSQEQQEWDLKYKLFQNELKFCQNRKIDKEKVKNKVIYLIFDLPHLGKYLQVHEYGESHL